MIWRLYMMIYARCGLLYMYIIIAVHICPKFRALGFNATGVSATSVLVYIINKSKLRVCKWNRGPEEGTTPSVLGNVSYYFGLYYWLKDFFRYSSICACSLVIIYSAVSTYNPITSVFRILYFQRQKVQDVLNATNSNFCFM
jgi:hypothetical protein